VTKILSDVFLADFHHVSNGFDTHDFGVWASHQGETKSQKATTTANIEDANRIFGQIAVCFGIVQQRK
jgi:hypothetical protein